MPAEPVRKVLNGWGAAMGTAADVLRVSSVASVGPIVAAAGSRGVLARGLGRAYGDAAQNAGGRVIEMVSLPPVVTLDTYRGEVTSGAGVSLDALMRTIVPLGWFVPVTPGTRQVTVGGAIAADIHGKNHHADGSFGQHVRSIELALADSSRVTVRPDGAEADLFWATTGGMGLTGVITDATVGLIPVQTSRILVDTYRANDLETVMALMEESDDRFRYSVAWVDMLATGKHLGRSVLTVGDHAPLDALSPKQARDPLAFGPSELLTAPPIFPGRLMGRAAVKAFNEAWFRKAPREQHDAVHTIGSFFHPLDGVAHWNRMYGARGFLQYQFVVPFSAADTLRRIMERIAHSGAASIINVLKRFGANAPGPLSFPFPGWTLTVDFPAGVPELALLLDEVDRMIAEVGGRLYLAKDSRMSPDMFRRTYPRLAEWQAVRDRVDPHGRFQSDLGRRLGLCKSSTSGSHLATHHDTTTHDTTDRTTNDE
jgi:decaprenylphospho-beta-D-ribofuranose 2-oxidase